MNYEDGMTPEERKNERKQFRCETSAPPKVITKANGFITVNIPPVTLPTPAAIARRLKTSPIVRYSLILLIGFAAGYAWHARPAMPTVQPIPVITVTEESLADFVARESMVLSAEERQKLIAVTQGILAEHFDTPSALREEFRFQRLKAGLDSPAFHNFSEQWEKRIEESEVRSQEDSVDFMREAFRKLLAGLQESEERSQETEEGVRSQELEVRRGEPEPPTPDSLLLSPDSSKTQRQRLLRRR